MSDYHLTIAEKQTGPHSQFYIIQGIREGRLRGTELIWRRGLEGWQPLRELEDFSSYWPPSPEASPKAQPAKEPPRDDLDRPRPWMRFWARMVDLIWWSFVCGLVVPIPALQWFAQNAFGSVLLGPLLFLAYVPLEGWMLSHYGTTPGKALLRIQVRTLPGDLPTFPQAAKRSLMLYVRGLALGLPYLSLFVMLWWKMRLARGGVAAWDEIAETRVVHGKPENWRYLLLAGILLGIFLTMLLQLSSPEFQATFRNSLSQ